MFKNIKTIPITTSKNLNAEDIFVIIIKMIIANKATARMAFKYFFII
jgi:hypothetical protein